MIIQRILLTEIPEVKFIRDTRSHNSGNIYVENLHRGRTKKNNFSKTEIHFHKKKNTPKSSGHIGLQKYESRSEIEFWATCHNISNLWDGC